MNTDKHRFCAMLPVIICVYLCSSVVPLSGCTRATVGEPLTGKLGGNDEASRMEFWHSLTERSVPSNDDAFHAFLLLFEDKDECADYAGRVARLKELGWLGAGFDEPAEIAVTRGTVAVILVQALKIEGGVTMHVFGVTPRYAMREAIYEGLMTPGSPQQTFSGGQFVALIGRLEDYQRTRSHETYTEGAP